MFLKYFFSGFLLLQYTLSVDVDLAVFNVTVLDSDRRPVTGLTLNNFHVYEDGREQQIKIFQPEDTPSTVGLVIDNSGSMANKRRDVVNAALAFVNASRSDDEMFVVDFNRRAWLALPASMLFTSSYFDLRAVLLETRTEGTTALYDALELALGHLKEGTRQRKALVLLSDGGDNASVAKLDAVLRIAQQSSATIYCIGIYDPYAKDKNPGVLKKIAKVTGGESYFPRTSADLQNIWPRIAGTIRGQYTIGYVSTNSTHDGSYRSVRIMARGKRGRALDVRSRLGYFGAR
ncbi:MAG TPA: VWA domain-containing protein [Terriglobia bacterium]|nr:VWA domain-containing protein [Terriglobia bacterium]